MGATGCGKGRGGLDFGCNVPGLGWTLGFLRQPPCQLRGVECLELGNVVQK